MIIIIIIMMIIMIILILITITTTSVIEYAHEPQYTFYSNKLHLVADLPFFLSS